MNKNKELTTSPITFEAAFQRLEEILEKMNTNTVSLDESLLLYEEADGLIAICNKRLNEAEKKVSILMKNRNGDLTIGADDKPVMQNFGSTTPPTS